MALCNSNYGKLNCLPISAFAFEDGCFDQSTKGISCSLSKGMFNDAFTHVYDSFHGLVKSPVCNFSICMKFV